MEETTEEINGYITLARAAEIAGYRGGAGNLRRAAATGKLKTVKLGRHHRLTTKAWLDEYLNGLSPTAGWPRGQERGPRQKPGDAGEPQETD
jgi:hypothetical protein